MALTYEWLISIAHDPATTKGGFEMGALSYLFSSSKTSSLFPPPLGHQAQLDVLGSADCGSIFLFPARKRAFQPPAHRPLPNFTFQLHQTE
jgi:hypothetical protein